LLQLKPYARFRIFGLDGGSIPDHRAMNDQYERTTGISGVDVEMELGEIERSAV